MTGRRRGRPDRRTGGREDPDRGADRGKRPRDPGGPLGDDGDVADVGGLPVVVSPDDDALGTLEPEGRQHCPSTTRLAGWEGPTLPRPPGTSPPGAPSTGGQWTKGKTRLFGPTIDPTARSEGICPRRTRPPPSSGYDGGPPVRPRTPSPCPRAGGVPHKECRRRPLSSRVPYRPDPPAPEGCHPRPRGGPPRPLSGRSSLVPATTSHTP